jgi:4-amino-4-deoxy-L-arabinose transferase-like glycosyltransferase
LLLHTAGTWILPLVDRDEPRFAEAAREMRERGDYVVPYFNSLRRFDKPPFIYWTQVASYRLFGENDFAARFPSAGAAGLTALLLFAWGRRLGNERVGWWAAIIFSLCLQTLIHAKAAVADMWLVFFVTAAHWAAYELIADSLGSGSAEAASSKRKYWRLVFYAALGFAFLTKGPLGWIPLLTVASTKLFLRGLPLNRRFWFATGTLGMLAIVLLWAAPALIRTNGEFFRVGIGRHVIERSFNLKGHGLLAFPFYFLGVFISFFPWSIKLPALARRLWRERDAVDKYLISGSAIVFIIATLVRTKHLHYTLPAFPLLALLLARHLYALPGSPRFAVRTAITAVAVSLGAALFLFPLLARTFLTVQLFQKSEKDILPNMDFANVEYYEPSVVWYFRSRTHGFFHGIYRKNGRSYAEQVREYMTRPGPRFAIMPPELASEAYPQIPPAWKSYTAHGFYFVKWRTTDLTMILKPTK